MHICVYIHYLYSDLVYYIEHNMYGIVYGVKYIVYLILYLHGLTRS